MQKTKTILKKPAFGRRDFLKLGAAATAATVAMPQSSRAQKYTGANNFSGSKVAPGVPRPWNVPQQKTAPISVDVHTHWAPEAYIKAKADLGRPDYANPVNYNMEKRKQWMDAHGVQTLVMTLGGFMPWQWVTPEQGAHIAQVSNDAAIEAHKAFPDRFLAGVELPVGDPEGSMKELNRVAGKPGMVAVHLPNSLAGRDYLFEPSFAPVLALCQELNLPLLIHPLDGEANFYAGQRLNDSYSGNNPNGPASMWPGLTNSIGETFEQATTMAKFIVTGTLDKYPTLQIVIAHAGGAFPFIAGRLDSHGGNRLPHTVQEYMRRFYYDSLTFWPISLQYLIDLVGSDRIMVGTDNAFNGSTNTTEQPHTLIEQLNLPAEDRDLILRGNAKRLFKI